MAAPEEVMATLNEYAAAYCAKDIDRLMAVFSDGEEISLIGTGADECCEGRSEVRAVFMRNFADATATRFHWHWKHIMVKGDFAVVAITLTIDLEMQGRQVSVPLRWTVALERSSGQWRWLHRNASAAAGTQQSGTAYPVGTEQYNAE